MTLKKDKNFLVLGEQNKQVEFYKGYRDGTIAVEITPSGEAFLNKQDVLTLINWLKE